MEPQNADLLFTIAQLGGIFVGFGALIGLSRDRGVGLHDLTMIRAVVMMGLFTLIGALIPVGIDAYDVEANLVWQISGGILFLVNLASIYVQFADSDIRKSYAAYARQNLFRAIFFWGVMEGSSQLLMISIIAGVFAALADAFYITVLIINLFQAAFLLVSQVYDQNKDDEPTESI